MIDCTRHHKLQVRNFYLEQTERLLTSDVLKKKKNKVGRKQKQHFMWSKYFQKKRSKTTGNRRAGSFGTVPGPILREYWPGNRAI